MLTNGKKNLFVIGHSHAINFLRACCKDLSMLNHENYDKLQLGSNFSDLVIKENFFLKHPLKAFVIPPNSNWGKIAVSRIDDGKEHIDVASQFEALLRSLEEFEEKDILISFINGNEHTIMSMIQHPVPFDFFLPNSNQSYFHKNRQTIPYPIIKKQMLQSVNSTVACLSVARHILPKMRIIHVLPPPPISSESQIKNAPEVFENMIEQYGISPIELRVKYYQLYADTLQNALQNRSIEFLCPPLKSLDHDGALKTEYAFAATHANEAYGHLIAEQISFLIA
jgi:hypothetical protein